MGLLFGTEIGFHESRAERHYVDFVAEFYLEPTGEIVIIYLKISIIFIFGFFTFVAE